MKTRIVALAQQKGGVAKTCTAINLACQAVAIGESAAIVDMDYEQGTVSRWYDRRQLANKSNGSLPPVIVVKADATNIEDVLEELRAKKLRWVFLDLPGKRSSLASAGMTVSDFVLVPCRPVSVDIEASIDTVKPLVRSGKPYSYLMNIAPFHNEGQRAKNMAQLIRNEGHPVSPIIIVQRIQVPDSLAAGKAVNESDPRGSSAQEFRELFQWLKQTMK